MIRFDWLWSCPPAPTAAATTTASRRTHTSGLITQRFLRFHAFDQLLHRYGCRRSRLRGICRFRVRSMHRDGRIRRQERLREFEFRHWHSGRDWIHDFGSYDDDQLGIVLGPLKRLEEPAENRNITEEGYFQEGFGFAIIEQSANCKALAVLKFDFRPHSANRNGRHSESGDGDGIREVERADFRRHLETDGSARRNGGDEVQPDTIVLELDCDDCTRARATALSHWIGVFTTCKEAGLFAILCKHVGFSERLNQAPGLKGFDGCSKVNPWVKGEELQRIRE